MSTVMTNKEFVEKLKDVALNHKNPVCNGLFRVSDDRQEQNSVL